MITYKYTKCNGILNSSNLIVGFLVGIEAVDGDVSDYCEVEIPVTPAASYTQAEIEAFALTADTTYGLKTCLADRITAKQAANKAGSVYDVSNL